MHLHCKYDDDVNSSVMNCCIWLMPTMARTKMCELTQVEAKDSLAVRLTPYLLGE